MAIPQTEKELDAAFLTAWQLKEKIKENYISRTRHIHLKKDEIQEEIIEFIKSNRDVVKRYIENKTTTEDILLAQIMKQFEGIHKTIESYKQTRKFFQNNPNNFIKEIEKKLKDINEIFNMLHWKYTDIPAESIKLTTDPRFNR